MDKKNNIYFLSHILVTFTISSPGIQPMTCLLHISFLDVALNYLNTLKWQVAPFTSYRVVMKADSELTLRATMVHESDLHF